MDRMPAPLDSSLGDAPRRIALTFGDAPALTEQGAGRGDRVAVLA